MITFHQPNNFPVDIVVGFSSRDDGTMLDRNIQFDDPEIVKTRQLFCDKMEINYEDCVYQKIKYGEEYTYDIIADVGRVDVVSHKPKGIYGDCLITEDLGVGIFLPVADCVATVVYDPVKRILAVMHMGRHSTVTDLIDKTVGRLRDKGGDPKDLLVWMSPSIKNDSYRLAWFDFEEDPSWQGFVERKSDGVYVDMPGYNRHKFIENGVLSENIVISTVDTSKDPRYFSHSIGDISGRMAVVAMMK